MQTIGTKVDDHTLVMIRLRAEHAKISVASYLRELIIRDISDQNSTMHTNLEDMDGLLSELQDINREIQKVKDLSIKAVKSSTTAAVIAESSADEVIRNRAREIAAKFAVE